jgi:hypothetical protein
VKADREMQHWTLDIRRCEFDFGQSRLLSVIDEATRTILATIAGIDFSGADLFNFLDDVISSYGIPSTITSERAAEFSSNAVKSWTERHGIEWRYRDEDVHSAWPSELIVPKPF